MKELQEYLSIGEQIAALTKQHDALKATIKSAIQRGEHQIGDFKVTLAERTRIDLDKKLVSEYLGEKVKDFEKISGYEVLLVKRVK